MLKSRWFISALALIATGGLVGTLAQQPAALPQGNAANGQTLSQRCIGCHGPAGNSTNPAFPRLAGQVPSYLSFQLIVLRGGQRPSPIMNGIAKGLKDQEIADLVAYFSSQSVGAAWPSTDAAARKAGEALYNAGDVKRDLIACAICHGADGRGINANGIALITRQAPDYFVKIMKEFASVPDFGVPPPNAMHIIAIKLKDADLKALAEYIKSMPTP